MPLTAADVKALDLNAEALGMPTAVLMENAGQAVADVVTERYPEGQVWVFCGLGNNGGDGAVAARVLREAGRPVRLLVVGDPDDMRTEEAADALAQAEEAGVPVVTFSDVHLEESLDEADLVVDAMLGVGVTGALRPPIDRIVATLNDHEVPVVAVDVPTGMGGDDPLYATVTVTMHDRKVGMADEVCGDIIVADIGVPDEAAWYVGPGDLIARYPQTDPKSHKGMMGKILVVAGGPYTGAPVLTASGALATGTDLVFMALPSPAVNVARLRLPEAIVHPLEGPALGRAHLYLIEQYLGDADVLAIGPGLGQDAETVLTVRSLVASADKRGMALVLDADAVKAFADDEDALRQTGAVITPHAGEFKALTGIHLKGCETHERIEAVQGWVGDSDVVVLLKGAEDIIVGSGQVAVNRTHHPVMTTGGTGDVLTGVVAALLGRKMAPFDAARVAAYLNGAAGLAAYANYSWGVKSSDLPELIPYVLADHLGTEW